MANSNIHGLEDLNPAWTGLDPKAAKPNINTNTHPWAVMLQNNIYVKGTCDGLDGDGIWKYSIAENKWSKHPRPNLVGYTNFILTTHRSTLACIGGYEMVQGPENRYAASSHIFIWNENGCSWDTDAIQIQDAESIPWRDASATSDGNNLFLGWQKDNKIYIQFLYQDGQHRRWMKRDGPECKSDGCHIELSIINSKIIVTQHSQYTATVISKASVGSIYSGFADSTHFGNMLWMEASWCKKDGMRRHVASYISNLVVLGQEIVLLDPQNKQPAMLFRLQWEGEPNRALAWIEAEKWLDFNWKSNTYPSMFGLSDGRVLVMGHSNIRDGQICVFKSGRIV